MTRTSKAPRTLDRFQVKLTAERPESVKPFFEFQGNADTSIMKRFEREILPHKIDMYYNICSVPILILCAIYFSASMFLWSLFFLFLVGVWFVVKKGAKRKMMNYIIALSPQLFEINSEHVYRPNFTMAFFEEYVAILLENGAEIQIFYPHLSKIVERDGYIAIFTKESFVFPVYNKFVSLNQKNEWLRFLKRKAPHIAVLHINQK